LEHPELLPQLLGRLDECAWGGRLVECVGSGGAHGDGDGADRCGCEMTLKSVMTWMSWMTWIHGGDDGYHGVHGQRCETTWKTWKTWKTWLHGGGYDG